MAAITRQVKLSSGKLLLRHAPRWSRSNRQWIPSRRHVRQRRMTTDKIHFTKEKETMLMTLNGRAIQSQWKNPILRDPRAEEAMKHIDYDMRKSLKGVSSWRMWNEIGC